MANVQITKHVTVQGDKPLKTAGVPLYALVGGKIQWNVSVGEPVAYIENPGRIPLTTDTATVSAANVHKLRFGVGHSSKGNGIVDGIRHIGAEKIGNCDIEHMSVASPVCGNPDVKDLYFDCVNCYDNYTVEFGIRDNFTQSYTAKMRDYATWYAAYTPNCKKCNDCDTTVTCDEVVDGIIDNLLQPNGRKLPNGQPYPDYVHPTDDFPFDVHKIYNRSLTYCLSFSEPASDCEDCNTLPAIASATIGGATVDLSAIVTPTDDTVLFKAQLDQVVALINDAFKASTTVNGKAYLTGVNFNTCCPLQLHVNTDDAAFALGTLTASVDINPFDVGESGEGFTCGIRIISAPLEGGCECLITKPLAMYGRKSRIRAIGDGFKDSKEVSIQDMEFPGGFGSLIQYQELYQSVGGEGRTYSTGNQVGTWLGGPRGDARVANAITAKCNKDYCQYHIRSRQHILNQADQQDSIVINSFINVESDATLANTQIKELLDKWATLSTSCMDAPVLQCTPLDASCTP